MKYKSAYPLSWSILVTPYNCSLFYIQHNQLTQPWTLGSFVPSVPYKTNLSPQTSLLYLHIFFRLLHHHINVLHLHLNCLSYILYKCLNYHYTTICSVQCADTHKTPYTASPFSSTVNHTNLKEQFPVGEKSNIIIKLVVIKINGLRSLPALLAKPYSFRDQVHSWASSIYFSHNGTLGIGYSVTFAYYPVNQELWWLKKATIGYSLFSKINCG